MQCTCTDRESEIVEFLANKKSLKWKIRWNIIEIYLQYFLVPPKLLPFLFAKCIIDEWLTFNMYAQFQDSSSEKSKSIDVWETKDFELCDEFAELNI